MQRSRVLRTEKYISESSEILNFLGRSWLSVHLFIDIYTLNGRCLKLCWAYGHQKTPGGRETTQPGLQNDGYVWVLRGSLVDAHA